MKWKIEQCPTCGDTWHRVRRRDANGKKARSKGSGRKYIVFHCTRCQKRRYK